jgi:hypothetical protein
MTWMIISLSILSAILVLALLISVDGHNPQPARASRSPQPAGRNGQAGRPIHSGRHRRVRQVFSMF